MLLLRIVEDCGGQMEDANTRCWFGGYPLRGVEGDSDLHQPSDETRDAPSLQHSVHVSSGMLTMRGETGRRTVRWGSIYSFRNIYY